MPTRKTYPFLPAQFQSEANKKFLNATMDQLTTEPNVKPINGYIGRKFTPGDNDIAKYIKEPNLTRANYQLEPGVTVKDKQTLETVFSVTYPEFLQQINYLGGNIANPNKLFNSDYYSYNPYINADSFVNFGQYYWVPSGPDPVLISSNVVDEGRVYYTATDTGQGVVKFNGLGDIYNPTITLTRGRVYTFQVNQRGYPFWIQTDPGVSGRQINNNNLSSREILGVVNNGTDNGTITFNIPVQTAQDQFINMQTIQTVDLATDLTYSQLQGANLATIVSAYGGIDGQRNNLNNKYIIFTGSVLNDDDWTADSTTVPVSQRYGVWKISINVVGLDSFVELTFYQSVPVNNKVIINSGVANGNTQWYTNPDHQLVRMPVFTATADQLYYQVGNLESAYGIIKLVDPGANTIDVEAEILGKLEFQSLNGVQFTNGLKIQFDSSVSPAEYQNKQYYVDGVGAGIRLVDVDNLIFNPTQLTTNYKIESSFTDSAVATINGNNDELSVSTNVNPTVTTIGTFPNIHNPNYVVEQDLTYVYPYRGGQNSQGDHTSIAYETGAIGMTVAGFPIYAPSSGRFINGKNGTQWTLTSSEVLLNGEDAYGGTVDSNGIYHYVNSNFITANAWGNLSGFTGGEYVSSTGHSKIIGIAADGYPIYGPYGYLDAGNADSPAVKMTSSYRSNNTGDYRPSAKTVTVTANCVSGNLITVSSTYGLNPGMRITVNDASLAENTYYVINNGLSTASGTDKFADGPTQVLLNSNVTIYAGSTLTFEFLEGAFIEDWVYVQNSGSLDRYNGRYCVTPEFPNGTYAYFATQDSTNKPVYPYFVGRAYYGSLTVDVDTSMITPDYITINRSSQDLNPWSRRNRWFHEDVLRQTAVYNRTAFDVSAATKATRPIIEFDPDIQLYNFGNTYKKPVNIFDNRTTQPLLTVEGAQNIYVDGVFLSEGLRIIFAADADPATRGKVWEVTHIDQDGDINTPKIIHLVEPSDSAPVLNQTVSVYNGLTNAGKSFWFNGTDWVEGQTKNSVNQAPLFDVFDSEGISLSDQTKYPISNQSLSFTGTKILSYVQGTGTNDSVLGFPLSYRNLNNIGDIKFQNNFATDTFLYSSNGVDYTKNISIGSLYKNNADGTITKLNTWDKVAAQTKQYQIFSFIYDGIDNNFTIDVVPNRNSTEQNLFVYANYRLIPSSGIRTLLLTGGKTQIWVDPVLINENERITVRVYSDTVSTSGQSYYEIPDNLNYNLENDSFSIGTLGDIRNHIKEKTLNSLKFDGNFPGRSNLRDISIADQKGLILQHSAPLSYGMLFLTSDDYNFVDAVTYAEQEYTKFKNKFLNLSELGSQVASWTVPAAVDAIMSKMNEFKTKEFPFFYSDMVPYGTNKNIINYTIFDPAQVNYQITNIFDITTLSNQAVLVYLNGVQLVHNKDYTFLTTAPGIALATALTRSPGDKLSIVEFADTDGSCVPSTPTKLGLYPKTYPAIITDYSYSTAQQFIRGHDGSLTPVFNDYRDNLLLELELRIYNNIKQTFDNKIIDIYKAKPGKFRNSDFSVADYNKLIAMSYLPWVGFSKLDYTTNNTFASDDPWSYNYGKSIDVIDGENLPGSWRACYEYFYDCQTPNLTPWEMLGFSEEPSWWESTYGPAPYTSGNKILWDDLELGYIAGGARIGVDSRFARAGLSTVIPVDENGNLKSPFGLLTVQFNNKQIDAKWIAGQYSPVETAWRNSSSYPFAVQRILASTNTASYFAEGSAVNKIVLDDTINQYINASTNSRLHKTDIVVNGYNYETATVDRAASYINWIAEYLSSKGIYDHSALSYFVKNYNVNLMYKMAGFTAKDSLKILAEQNSPSSINDSVLIPDNNFELILNKSTPINNIRYSAVIIEKISSGFKISGYDNQSPLFNIVLPEINNQSNSTEIYVNKYSVKWYQGFKSVRASIPYGTVLSDIQQVANFLAGYQQWLKTQGFTFDTFDENLGLIRNWELSAKEFLFWVQQGWAAGSVLVLSPFADKLDYSNPIGVVDAITDSVFGSKILNQNWQIVDSSAYSINRDKNTFNISLNTSTDLISLAVFDVVQYEHAVIFDNMTEFNDVIYEPRLGQRQYRLKLSGFKTQGWTGAVDPQGYIYSTPAIESWQQNKDYLRGDLVEYKGFLYTALSNLPGVDVFDFADWQYENKNNLKTGLLENFATKAKKIESYYDTDRVNLEKDTDNLAFDLIGFKSRNYLVDIGMPDASQLKFYQGFIKQKGTRNAAIAFNQTTASGQQTSIELDEEWALRVGDYGASDTNRFVELSLLEQAVKNNPVSLEVFSNSAIVYSSLDTQLNAVYGYSTETFNSPFFLNRTADSSIINDIKTAGYANIDDIDVTLFDINDLEPLNQNLNSFHLGTLIWVAKTDTNDWDVLRVSKTNTKILSLANALNSDIKITTSSSHNLSVNDIVLVDVPELNRFSGFYKIKTVTDNFSFTVTTNQSLQGFNSITFVNPSTLYKLESQRKTYTSQILDINNLQTWDVNSKVWIDNVNSGDWGVYNKTEPWDITYKLPKGRYETDGKFGHSVKLSYDNNFALVGEPGSYSGQGSITNYALTFNDSFSEDNSTLPRGANTVSYGTSLDSGIDYLIVGAPGSSNGIGYAYVYYRDFQGAITETQLLVPPSGNAEAFGTSVIISSDDEWAFVGAPDADKVYAYGFDSSVVTEVQELIAVWASNVSYLQDSYLTYNGNLYIVANTFTSSSTFDATDLTLTSNVSGFTTDFAIASTELLHVTDANGKTYVPFIEFTSNASGINFTSPITSSVSSLVVRQAAGFRLMDTITGNANSNFGFSLAHTTESRQVAIGAPADNSDTGTITIYDRTVENFIAVDSNVFGGVRPLTYCHKVFVNGVLQTPNVDYVVIGDTYAELAERPESGSIITLETNMFNKVQTLVDSHPQANAQWGFAIDICRYNCSLYVGAPYYNVGKKYNVGKVYRYLNQGRVYGTITGTVENPTVTSGSSLRINDYEVEFLSTSLDEVVLAINNANIPGVTAVNLNGYLQINSDSYIIANKLNILPGTGSAIEELGLEVFYQVQEISNPTSKAYDLFGYSLKIDSTSTILSVGGPTAYTFTHTTFDSFNGLYPSSTFGSSYVTNPNSTQTNATTFDGSATKFVDDVSSGAVWIMNLLTDARETIDNPGQFAFIQQLDPSKLGLRLVPGIRFGQSLDINNYEMIVGTENDSQYNQNNGTVYQFNNYDRLGGWDLIRSQLPKVDINGITKGYTFNKNTQIIVDNLDYIDPAKGKILGIAEQELTFKTDYDPAVYNNSTQSALSTSDRFYWGSDQVGQVWWDLSSVRYIDYEQDTVKYRTKNWGRYFPGSTIDVYEWVESLYPPSRYVALGGDGIPKYSNDTAYVTETYVESQSNFATVKYYFWVKNKTSVPNMPGRSLPITALADYINDPINSGIKYFAVIKDNAVALYNVNDDLVGDSLVLHIDYSSKLNDAIIHSEYALVNENSRKIEDIPTSIYTKLVDSLSGTDSSGRPVPDPGLPASRRYGIDFRPRQGMFINKDEAVKQLVSFVNAIFETATFAENISLNSLGAAEPVPAANSGYYDIIINTLDELAYVDIITKPVGYKVLVLSDSSVSNLWTIYVKDLPTTQWQPNTAFARGLVISNDNQAYRVIADNYTSGNVFSFDSNYLSLYQANNTWMLTQVQTYNAGDYWITKDWYASYFDKTTQPKFTFQTTADMVNTKFKSGDLIKINNNGQGKWMLLQIFANTSVMVGLQDGTIELLSSLYDTSTNGIGFGNDNFDTIRFDQNPSIEIRKIISTLRDGLFINQYSSEFVNLFFVLLNYVFEEQKSVDWAFKTSFINVLQKVNSLNKSPLYFKENQTYYQNYIEEIKPYHSTIREYINDYLTKDNVNGYVTDFDLPAYYDSTFGLYRSPSGQYAQDLVALQAPQYKDYLNSYWYGIEELVITNGGSGYTVTPAIVITGSTVGDNAVAVASISNGSISKIQILYPGSNYISQPTVTISGGNGTGATLYAKLGNYSTRKIKTTLAYDRITFNSSVVDWEPNTSYNVGDIISYNNVAYIVNNAFTSGTTFIGNDLSVYPSDNFKNANDRIAAYYTSAVGLPGKNPELLQTGLSYPGVTIEGPLFTDAGGFDVAGFDTEYFDALTVDSDGTYVISDLILDTKLESDFTDTSLGLRPEDIIVDGDGFVTPYTSHAPEELIPGRVYDTLDLTVQTMSTLEDSAYNVWASDIGFYVHDIAVVDGGAGYASNAIVTISGDTGSNASANITLDANGTITAVTVTSNGSGYLSTPNVSIVGANANLNFAAATVTAHLDQDQYTTFSFRMFKDMNDNWTYYREDPVATTYLTADLTFTSNTISVQDSSNLFEPNPSMNLPGVIYINGERITYFVKDDSTNTLSQIRRGTAGTGAKVHSTNDLVVSGGTDQLVPYSSHTAKTFDSNTTVLTTAAQGYTFIEGQTYIQTNLWLSTGSFPAELITEANLLANLGVTVVTTESLYGVATDDLYSYPTDGRGLYGSTTIQALFVKKQIGT